MKLDDTTNQILSSLTQWKLSLIAALPNLVTAFIVLILGWVLAWTLRRVVRRIFRRLAAQIPSGTGRAAWSEAVDDNDVGNVAAGGVYWLVLLVTSMVAIDALDIAVFSRWVGAFASYLPRLALAAAILFVGIVGGRLARNAIVKTADSIAGIASPRPGSFRAAGDRDRHRPRCGRAAGFGCVALERRVHDFGGGHTRGCSVGVRPRGPRHRGGHSGDALREQVPPDGPAGSSRPRRRTDREDEPDCGLVGDGRR